MSNKQILKRELQNLETKSARDDDSKVSTPRGSISVPIELNRNSPVRSVRRSARKAFGKEKCRRSSTCSTLDEIWSQGVINCKHGRLSRTLFTGMAETIYIVQPHIRRKAHEKVFEEIEIQRAASTALVNGKRNVNSETPKVDVSKVTDVVRNLHLELKTRLELEKLYIAVIERQESIISRLESVIDEDTCAQT